MKKIDNVTIYITSAYKDKLNLLIPAGIRNYCFWITDEKKEISMGIPYENIRDILKNGGLTTE